MKKHELILASMLLFLIPGMLVFAGGSQEGKPEEGEKIKITIMDYSDAVKPYRDAANEAYMRENPHIEVEYTLITSNQLKSTIMTAVGTGQAPDLFPLPGGFQAITAVEEEWYLPLEQFFDDPKVWDKFNKGTFAEGKCLIGGKIYFIPENPYGPSSSFFYNRDIFKEAGLDPANPPKYYSDFREAAKRITEAGSGRYYGVIEACKQLNRMDAIAVDWANLIGAAHQRSGFPLDMRTGTPEWRDEAVYTVFEFWKNLYEDGSIHPNSAAYINPDARAAFAEGQAGMIVNGWWNVGVWKANNPNLDFGVAPPPRPDGQEFTGSIPLVSSNAWLGVYSQSKHPEEAAHYLINVVAGEAFQSAAVAAGVHISFLKGINETKNVIPEAAEFYRINSTYGKLAPECKVANPDTAIALGKFKDVSPNPYEIFAGVLSGSVKDYKKALAEYSEAATKSWLKTIEDTNAENGLNLTLDDFKFDDWDPMADYTY